MYAVDEHSAFNKLMEGYPGSECFDPFERLKQINAIIHGSETVLPTTNLKDAIEKPATFPDHFLRADWYNMHDVAVSLSRLSYFLTHLPWQNARYRDSLQAILLPSDKAGLPLIVFKEVKNIRFYEGDHNDWDPDTEFVAQLYKRWEISKEHILSLPKTGLEAFSATCPTEMNSITSPR